MIRLWLRFPIYFRWSHLIVGLANSFDQFYCQMITRWQRRCDIFAQKQRERLSFKLSEKTHDSSVWSHYEQFGKKNSKRSLAINFWCFLIGSSYQSLRDPNLNTSQTNRRKAISTISFLYRFTFLSLICKEYAYSSNRKTLYRLNDYLIFL